MHLILVAPGLLAQSQPALAAASSLAMLAQFAPVPHVHAAGIAAALLDALDAPADTPVAPLTALGAGMDVGSDFVLAADPVLLAADRDDLVLVQRIDDLAASESEALAATLNRHFATDDLRFVAVRSDAWFVRSDRAPAIETTPFDAARAKGVFPYLPRGAEGGVWQRWQNEIGMLLHEHPVNIGRQAAGNANVTGIWFWGGGRLSDAVGLPAVLVSAAPGRVGDFARGIAQHGGGIVHAFDGADTPSRVLGHARTLADGREPRVVVVAESVVDDGAAATLDAQWLAPALELLKRQRIGRLSLIADGNGAAARWSATPPTLWRRVTASARRRPFAAPASS